MSELKEKLINTYNQMSHAKVYSTGYLEGYRKCVVDIDEIEGEQPTLNENQRIVLDYLKEITIEDVSPMRAMEFLKYELKPNEYGGFQASTVGEAFYNLNNKEEAQVLQAFASWVIESEE